MIVFLRQIQGMGYTVKVYFPLSHDVATLVVRIVTFWLLTASLQKAIRFTIWISLIYLPGEMSCLTGRLGVLADYRETYEGSEISVVCGS